MAIIPSVVSLDWSCTYWNQGAPCRSPCRFARRSSCRFWLRKSCSLEPGSSSPVFMPVFSPVQRLVFRTLCYRWSPRPACRFPRRSRCKLEITLHFVINRTTTPLPRVRDLENLHIHSLRQTKSVIHLHIHKHSSKLTHTSSTSFSELRTLGFALTQSSYYLWVPMCVVNLSYQKHLWFVKSHCLGKL